MCSLEFKGWPRIVSGSARGPIRSAIAALTQASDEFAARRMDRSVRSALAGQRVDELET